MVVVVVVTNIAVVFILPFNHNWLIREITVTLSVVAVIIMKGWDCLDDVSYGL